MKIPITKPYFDHRERELITKPLNSGWVVQGPYVKEFETKMAEFVGAKYAAALNSCTSGQFILSQIIGLQPGDEVIVPAFTWISTANAVEFLGATPVFCDIDIDTFNIDVSKIEEKITANTQAIYPVHLFGLCADMTEIMKMSESYGLTVIEDAACGLGGKIGERHCGSFGKAGVFSFHPRKSITTGEGGMIVTDDKHVAEQAESLRDHGSVKTDYERHHQKDGFMLTEYPNLGWNVRMTDIQAALGVAQMEKLDWILREKQQLASEYDERLAGIGWLKAPAVPTGYTHGYQAYCTLFKPEETREAIKERDRGKIDRLHIERNELMARLEEKGIATRQGTHAVHIQEFYREKYYWEPCDFPAAYAADRLTVALPFYPTITKEEKDYLFGELHRL
ncbi:MAG: DegT/DnrJ/EryC1/StrS family aminotransferase [bacterium]|nr:DegT/DnrJ/EryC1/StrS family aminotransferase [bacterium]